MHDAPPTTDDEFEKHTVSICMASTCGRYLDLSVIDLNQVSIEHLTFDPGYQFSYHGALDLTPLLPKSSARHQPLPGDNFLPSFVSSCTFSVEQSWSEALFSDKVSTYPSILFVTLPSSFV